MTNSDFDRRSRLLSAKLAFLVSKHLNTDTSAAVLVPCGLGAGLVLDDEVWILVSGDARGSLGPAIAWSTKHAGTLHLVVENHSALLARRSSQFTMPIFIWHLDGDQFEAATSQHHQPFQSATEPHAEFFSQIANAGAEPLIEWGVVTGEVRGLEICRVVDDENTGQAILEVGIGVHDRETFALVHQARPIDESIASVVATVVVHRELGAPFHPYNYLAPERFARWRAISSPTELGFTSLIPVDPPMARSNVKDSVPCVAYGVDGNEIPTAIVFVHGINLDIVPLAIDSALQHSCSKALIVARSQDVTDSIRTMANVSSIPVSFFSFS